MAYAPVNDNVSCTCTGDDCPTRRLRDSPATAVSAGACDESAAANGLEGMGIMHDCFGRRNGDSCVAKCSEGYTMQEGPSLYTCRAGTLVSAAPPRCVPKACTSGLPSGEGVAHNCEGVVTGSTCTATCGAGYGGDNERVFRCADSGMLVGSSPVCKPLPCQALVLPRANFTHDCADAKTGGKCSVHCAAPLVGQSEGFSCSASGTLEGVLPKCRAPAAAAGGASSRSPSRRERIDYVICTVARQVADMERMAHVIADDHNDFALHLRQELMRAGADKASELVLESFSTVAPSVESKHICTSQLAKLENMHKESDKGLILM
mmetsp:Transcript_11953/g.24766  ORF Transcript_11953/g.24766 Transcript_11953/m.24766 type:complete len:321 (+) Transcript_11953:3-965(+)